MATTINFATPESSTSRSVGVTGTVARNTLGHLTITLDITNTGTSGRNQTIYREIDYDNTASATHLDITASYTLSIVPKLFSGDTVTAAHSWSYS